MSVLDASGHPDSGATFTLSFGPTGLGNPFDSANDWFTAGAGNGNFTVQQVNMGGGFFTTDEIDVVINYNGSSGEMSYQDISTVFTSALNSLIWGYTLLGVQAGAVTGLPNTNTTPLSSSGGISSTLLYVGLGLLVIAVGFAVFKKEVL